MKKSRCNRSTVKGDQDETVNSDISEETESQSTSSSEAADDLNSDPDYIPDDSSEQDLTCHSTNMHSEVTVIENLPSSTNNVRTLEKSKSVHDIIRFGSTSEFTKLISTNFKITVLNEKNQTVLHLLFNEQSWNWFDLLDNKLSVSQKKSNNIDFTDCDGLTHLHIACARGSLSLVKRYLKQNYKVNARYTPESSCTRSNFTPLHFALLNTKVDKVEIVKQLIKAGTDVNAVDAKGRTPLHIAARIFEKQLDVDSDKMMSIEIMTILLENQNDINARDTDGNTPLLSVFTLFHNEFNTEKYKLELRPHVKIHMPETKSKLKFFLEHRVDVAATNNYNQNLLHLVLRNLIKYRDQFDKADYIFDDSNHIEMINQILSANPNIDVNLESNESEIPLQMAVACMSPKIVEILLDHDADLEKLTFKLKPPLGNFFCYPDLVVIYEPLRDLFDVLDILKSRGFKLTSKEHLVIFNFFKYQCESVEYNNIKLLLHYGTKDQIIKALDDVYYNLNDDDNFCYCDCIYADSRNEDLKYEQEFYIDMMEYLDTMRMGVTQRDEDVEKMVEDVTELLSKPDDENFDYMKYLEKDLNSLKSIKFTNSLYDILKKDPHDIPRFIINEFDLKMIQNLHCFKDMVKAQITKARIRFMYENCACEYLKIICDLLPEVCQMIAVYLRNDDIYNLCQATIIIIN